MSGHQSRWHCCLLGTGVISWIAVHMQTNQFKAHTLASSFILVSHPTQYFSLFQSPQGPSPESKRNYPCYPEPTKITQPSQSQTWSNLPLLPTLFVLSEENHNEVAWPCFLLFQLLPADYPLQPSRVWEASFSRELKVTQPSMPTDSLSSLTHLYKLNPRYNRSKMGSMNIKTFAW